jgi:hypothetical protein
METHVNVSTCRPLLGLDDDSYVSYIFRFRGYRLADGVVDGSRPVDRSCRSAPRADIGHPGGPRRASPSSTSPDSLMRRAVACRSDRDAFSYTLVFTLKRFPAHPSDRREGERTVALGSTTTRRLVKDQRLSFDYKHTNAALVEPSALNEGDDFDIFAGVRVSRAMSRVTRGCPSVRPSVDPARRAHACPVPDSRLSGCPPSKTTLGEFCVGANPTTGLECTPRRKRTFDRRVG